MAANVAKKEDSILAISDVSELYDQYFKSVHDDIFNDANLNGMTDLSSQILLKTASIISFFKAVDRENEEMMSLIEKVLGISKNEFWEAALFLHETEFVDMYENVVRMSDQVLGTYFFYLCLFKKNIIEFGMLLNHTFPQFKHRIVDSLNPVLSSFDHRSIFKSIKPVISTRINHFRKEGDTGRVHDLLETFWFVNETETLLFAKLLIEDTTSENISIDQVQFTIDNNSPPDRSVLSLLKPFSNASPENIGIAIDLILDYAQKSPSYVPKILGVLTRDFGFKLHSYRRRFEIQELVVEKLIQRISKGEDLFKYTFLAVAGQFLKTQFESSGMKDNRTVQFTRFSLPLSSDTKQLRNKIWQHIFELSENEKYKEEVLKLVQCYSQPHLEFEEEKELVEWESDLLLSHLSNVVESSEYEDVSTFQSYLDLLDRYNITYDKSLREQYTNDIYQISEIFLSEWGVRDSEKHTWEEYHNYKKAQLNEFIESYTIENFVELIDACIVIRKNPAKNRSEYLISQRLQLVFDILTDSNSDLFLEAIRYYLSIGDPFNIRGWEVIESWLTLEKPNVVLESIKGFEFSNKDRWIFCYYEALPEQKISKIDTNNLYELYNSVEAKNLPRDWNYLTKYTSQHNKAVETVLQTLVERAKENPDVISALDMLFLNFENIESLIRSTPKEVFEAVKKAYLLVSAKRNHTDYKGTIFNLLLDRDIDFIKEFVNSIYPEDAEFINDRGDNRDFVFIWNRDDYKKIIDLVVDQVYANEQKLKAFWRTNLEIFFDANFKENSSKEVQEKQFEYFKECILNRCEDIDYLQFLFRVIKKFPAEKRRKMIELFIGCNLSYAYFKKLQLEPTSWGGVGSMVPVYAGRIKFYESLLPLMNSADLLSHKTTY